MFNKLNLVLATCLVLLGLFLVQVVQSQFTIKYCSPEEERREMENICARARRDEMIQQTSFEDFDLVLGSAQEQLENFDKLTHPQARFRREAQDRLRRGASNCCDKRCPVPLTLLQKYCHWPKIDI